MSREQDALEEHWATLENRAREISWLAANLAAEVDHAHEFVTGLAEDEDPEDVKVLIADTRDFIWKATKARDGLLFALVDLSQQPMSVVKQTMIAET